MKRGEYQRIIRKYASSRIKLTRQGLNDIRAMLRAASRDIAGEVERLSAVYGQDNIRVEQLKGLRERIDKSVDELTVSYRASVDVQRDRLATNAITRNAELTKEVTGITPAADILARAKLSAFEKLASRTRFKDGMLLSQRIWKAGEVAKRDIGTTLSMGILKGTHPNAVAKQLRGYVTGKGRNNLRYVTERLARTEYAAANSEASRASIRALNREKSIPVRFGMRFNVSPGHPDTDICDAGLTGGDIQPDIYSEGMFPTLPYHPNCLCYDSAVPLDKDGQPLI